jgi:hypothetical protein
MVKRTLNILIIAVLAMNLMAAWALAMPFDCGMECCKASETTAVGIPNFEAPSCCNISDTTCAFEVGDYDEIFDEVVCRTNAATNFNSGSVYLDADVTDSLTDSPIHPIAVFTLANGPPSETPLFLANAAFLC